VPKVLQLPKYNKIVSKEIVWQAKIKVTLVVIKEDEASTQ
jgi:hypothetical protein